MATRSYHHGDLRTALIEAALASIERTGGDELSLREIARSVGVSAAAVYRHFPDKDALMAAVAQVGYDRLAAAQQAASDAAGGGAAGFSATGATYVRFALANPGLFRLVFAHPAPHGMLGPDGTNPTDAMKMLQETAARLAPPGSDPGLLALRAWALVHGLAMLLLDGQVTLDDAGIAAAVDVRALVDPAANA
mgnify:CR=1 FL=1